MLNDSSSRVLLLLGGICTNTSARLLAESKVHRVELPTLLLNNLNLSIMHTVRWWYWSKVFQHNHWRKNYKYTLRRKSQYMGAIISRYLCSKTIFVNALTKMVFKQRYLEMIAPLGRKNNKMRWENLSYI